MAFYECVFIARQDITSAQVDSLVEAFTKILQDNGGQVASKEYWGLRTLAYKIKKNRKGHYVMLNVEAPAEAVLEMERNMRISDDVIRYLTISVEQLGTEPSAMMQQRGGRDERPGRRGGGRFGERSGDRGDRGGERGDRGGDRGGRFAQGDRDGDSSSDQGASA